MFTLHREEIYILVGILGDTLEQELTFQCRGVRFSTAVRIPLGLGVECRCSGLSAHFSQLHVKLSQYVPQCSPAQVRL